MAELEQRLVAGVARRPGLRRGRRRRGARGGRQAPAAAALLPRLAAGRDGPPLAAGVAVELVHMATLVHDDLVDGARMRRGAPAAWSVFGAGRRARGRRLPLRAARSASSPTTGDSAAVAVLADACLALARGEALQRRQTHDPDTHDRRLPRALRAEDREAVRGGVPARLGRRSGARRLRPLARDRVPDRRRHPRLRGPDAGDREDPRHRPARGHADDAAAPRRAARTTSSARRSRAARSTARSCGSRPPTRSPVPRGALDYASSARSFLGRHPHREELEALTYAVVDRAS